MTIVSRSGDKGKTTTTGGKKVSKADPIIEVYGTLDELNVAIGTALCFVQTEKSKTLLAGIQKDIFEIAAHVGKDEPRIRELEIKKLENEIKVMEEKLQVMQHFIIPGGTKGSCFLHQARVSAREVERRMTGIKANLIYIAYFNRLSDFLFVLARWENKEEGVDEEIWKDW